MDNRYNYSFLLHNKLPIRGTNHNDSVVYHWMQRIIVSLWNVSRLRSKLRTDKYKSIFCSTEVEAVQVGVWTGFVWSVTPCYHLSVLQRSFRTSRGTMKQYVIHPKHPHQEQNLTNMRKDIIVEKTKLPTVRDWKRVGLDQWLAQKFIGLPSCSHNFRIFAWKLPLCNVQISKTWPTTRCFTDQITTAPAP